MIMAVPVGLGVGGLYLCYKMNEVTNQIADTVQELRNKLKDLIKELDGMQDKDSGSNLDAFDSIHDHDAEPQTDETSPELKKPVTESHDWRKDWLAYAPPDSPESERKFHRKRVEDVTSKPTGVSRPEKLKQGSEEFLYKTRKNEPLTSAAKAMDRCEHMKPAASTSDDNPSGKDEVSCDHLNEEPTTAQQEPEKPRPSHASDSLRNIPEMQECSGVAMHCILTTDWVHQIDLMLDGDESAEKERAYNILMSKVTAYPQCSELFWRLAKGAHQMSSFPGQETSKKRQLVFLAKEHATRALETNTNNAEAHKWYAITLAAVASFVKIQEKIHNACSFKKHVDIALSLRPSDPVLHHMLGKWCLEVSTMAWQDHRASFVLCWCLLNATMNDSVHHFTQAYYLKPNWKHNILFLTKAYLENKDYQNACDLAEKGLALPNITEEDTVAHAELESIFTTITNYPTTQSSHDEVSLHSEH